jgi:hypothetical protein
VWNLSSVALVKRWVRQAGRPTAGMRLKHETIEPQLGLKINRRQEVNVARMG